MSKQGMIKYLKSGKFDEAKVNDGTVTVAEIKDKLVGKDVLFVANFAPRKMMGFESQGMILSAVDFDGSLAVTSLLRGVKPGSQVG